MANKNSGNNWKDVVNSLHFTDTLDDVKLKVAEVNPEYSFEQFMKDCEAFYDLYIDFVGFNEDKAPSKNLQIQFHKVARILNMYGHIPDEVDQEATESMFDYLAHSPNSDNTVHTASSYTDIDDPLLEDHLAPGLTSTRSSGNNISTSYDEVDRIENIDGKPKLSICRVLNVRIASEELANNSLYINQLLDFYKIKNTFIDSNFNRDKSICSIYYK